MTEEYSSEDIGKLIAKKESDKAVSDALVEGRQQIGQGEYLAHIVQPDRSGKNADKLTQKWFTKELKVSNIKKGDLTRIVLMTDIGMQIDRIVQKLGKYHPNSFYFSDHLLNLRDTFFSASSSIGAKERTLQVTAQTIADIRTDQPSGFKLFRKKSRRD